MTQRVPMQLVPAEFRTYFGKTIVSTGLNCEFDTVYIDGSLDDWDFTVYYGKGDELKAVTASANRVRDVMVLREAFRVSHDPEFSSIVEGMSVDKIETVVRVVLC